MTTIEWIGTSFALLVLLFNGALYARRAAVLRHLEGCERDEPRGLLNAVTAFIGECAAVAAVTLLIPVGWRLTRCADGDGPCGPLLLVHGWGLNGGALWWLRRRLLHDGWSPVCVLNYPSVTADIECAATQLHALVEHVAPDRPVTIVAHGFGGLVVRHYLRRHLDSRVRRVVTLGTPHRGTHLGMIGSGGGLMPESPLMRELNAADTIPRQYDVIAIQSLFDATVLPPANAEYPGAFNVRVTTVGHHALLFSPRVYRLLIENLAAPLTAKPHPIPAVHQPPVLQP